MKLKKWVCVLLAVFLLAGLFCMPALAAADDVADAVEQTWGDASEQIKTVVDSVVFPALGMVLAIAFFVKLAMAYFDYRKHGQFEWTGPAILFVCLIFVLLAPNYIWGIVGPVSYTHLVPGKRAGACPWIRPAGRGHAGGIHSGWGKPYLPLPKPTSLSHLCVEV